MGRVLGSKKRLAQQNNKRRGGAERMISTKEMTEVEPYQWTKESKGENN